MSKNQELIQQLQETLTFLENKSSFENLKNAFLNLINHVGLHNYIEVIDAHVIDFATLKTGCNVFKKIDNIDRNQMLEYIFNRFENVDLSKEDYKLRSYIITNISRIIHTFSKMDILTSREHFKNKLLNNVGYLFPFLLIESIIYSSTYYNGIDIETYFRSIASKYNLKVAPVLAKLCQIHHIENVKKNNTITIRGRSINNISAIPYLYYHLFYKDIDNITFNITEIPDFNTKFDHWIALLQNERNLMMNQPIMKQYETEANIYNSIEQYLNNHGLPQMNLSKNNIAKLKKHCLNISIEHQNILDEHIPYVPITNFQDYSYSSFYELVDTFVNNKFKDDKKFRFNKLNYIYSIIKKIINHDDLQYNYWIDDIVHVANETPLHKNMVILMLKTLDTSNLISKWFDIPQLSEFIDKCKLYVHHKIADFYSQNANDNDNINDNVNINTLMEEHEMGFWKNLGEHLSSKLSMQINIENLNNDHLINQFQHLHSPYVLSKMLLNITDFSMLNIPLKYLGSVANNEMEMLLNYMKNVHNISGEQQLKKFEQKLVMLFNISVHSFSQISKDWETFVLFVKQNTKYKHIHILEQYKDYNLLNYIVNINNDTKEIKLIEDKTITKIDLTNEENNVDLTTGNEERKENSIDLTAMEEENSVDLTNEEDEMIIKEHQKIRLMNFWQSKEEIIPFYKVYEVLCDIDNKIFDKKIYRESNYKIENFLQDLKDINRFDWQPLFTACQDTIKSILNEYVQQNFDAYLDYFDNIWIVTNFSLSTKNDYNSKRKLRDLEETINTLKSDIQEILANIPIQVLPFVSSLDEYEQYKKFVTQMRSLNEVESIDKDQYKTKIQNLQEESQLLLNTDNHENMNAFNRYIECQKEIFILQEEMKSNEYNQTRLQIKKFCSNNLLNMFESSIKLIKKFIEHQFSQVTNETNCIDYINELFTKYNEEYFFGLLDIFHIQLEPKTLNSKFFKIEIEHQECTSLEQKEKWNEIIHLFIDVDKINHLYQNDNVNAIYDVHENIIRSKFNMVCFMLECALIQIFDMKCPRQKYFDKNILVQFFSHRIPLLTDLVINKVDVNDKYLQLIQEINFNPKVYLGYISSSNTYLGMYMESWNAYVVGKFDYSGRKIFVKIPMLQMFKDTARNHCNYKTNVKKLDANLVESSGILNNFIHQMRQNLEFLYKGTKYKILSIAKDRSTFKSFTQLKCLNFTTNKEVKLSIADWKQFTLV